MSTSEASIVSRALYDSLVGGVHQSLRAAASLLNGLDGQQAVARISALPETTPREVRNLLLALAQENKLALLPDVVREFEHYARRGERPLTGEITSAVALDAVQQKKITEQLRQSYGSALQLEFSVDPSLIGGLIIRVGDQVLDNSVRTRLSAVQRNMMAS